MAGGTSQVPGSSGKKKARIEIIPLIDVIFFLLATFVLFTLSLDRLQSVPVDLPYADATQNQQKEPPEDLVTIQVSDAGTYYWNKEIIGLTEIEPRLNQFMNQWPDPKVLIAGDDKARFGPVLDQVRQAGITKVSVETRVRPTGR